MTDAGQSASADPAEDQFVALVSRCARAEGYSDVGVATLAPSRHRGHLVRWLERGDHAAMAWLERRVALRSDPRQLLHGAARSAVVVALDYWPLAHGEGANGERRERESDLWQGVARYARGDDYHTLMEKRLERIEEKIQEVFPTVLTRRYVDTGPLLEREVAEAAGLGRPGKNTMLLSRRGSWFLLGAIVTSLELDTVLPPAGDKLPPLDMCGACTRCLDACPTGALPEPFRLDARRCISYWTIEHRGAIPLAMRDQLQGWVFGCDICQEVCPWNEPRKASSASQPAAPDSTSDSMTAALALPGHRRELDLVQLLAMTREEYTERFRRSPMKRARLEGLKRNAALAMAHYGDRSGYREALAAAATDDEDETVRSHAAWALECLREKAGGDDGV